jgi:hypothetical protein
MWRLIVILKIYFFLGVFSIASRHRCLGRPPTITLG